MVFNRVSSDKNHFLEIIMNNIFVFLAIWISLFLNAVLTKGLDSFLENYLFSISFISGLSIFVLFIFEVLLEIRQRKIMIKFLEDSGTGPLILELYKSIGLVSIIFTVCKSLFLKFVLPISGGLLIIFLCKKSEFFFLFFLILTPIVAFFVLRKRGDNNKKI